MHKNRWIVLNFVEWAVDGSTL